MASFTFQTTRVVYSAAGLSRNVPSDVLSLLGRRVLLVTDATVRRAGLTDPFVNCLSLAGIAVTIFDKVMPEPPEDNVHAAVHLAKAVNATGVVGFGGGSPMDVAKATALVAGNEQPLDEAYGLHRATGPRLPLVLVPTTAGTGSEATPIAILTAGNSKKGIASPLIIPDAAILDPELTLGVPPSVTAATGIDAMVHAIEAYASTSPNRNPISQGLAREALRLLGANIRRVFARGDDIEARGAMLIGSLLAGQAFANSPVAAVHALSYPIGARFHIAHGLSNALVLPEVLRFNLPYADAVYAAIAADAFPQLSALPESRRGVAMIDSLAALIVDLGLPSTLQSAGVPEDSLETMADEAMLQTRLLVNNPRPVTRRDALQIYVNAYR